VSDSVVNADIEIDQTPGIGRRIAAEIFGTFTLVFGLVGTALFASGNVGWLGVSFAIGITVIGAAYAVGHISGGHFNPAVTIGAAAAGRFSWVDVPAYVGAQILGGLIGTTLIFAIAADGPTGFLAEVQAAGFASNGWGEHSPGGFGIVAVSLTELILTAVFVLIILGVTDRRAPSGFAPLAIGLSLALIHLVSIPVSNTSVNPARSIATAVYGGGGALGQLWLFIVVPLLGALIAGFAYGPLFERVRRN